MEKRLEDAERELSSLSADLSAAHKRLRRDAGASTAEELRAASRKGEEAALAQVCACAVRRFVDSVHCSCIRRQERVSMLELAHWKPFPVRGRYDQLSATLCSQQHLSPCKSVLPMISTLSSKNMSLVLAPLEL